jgi:hypothetical protein
MDLHSNVIWNIKIVDTIYNYTIYKNKINTEYNEYSNTIEMVFFNDKLLVYYNVMLVFS